LLVSDICGQFMSTTAGALGFDRFLWQILLGSELIVRLLKEPKTTSYHGRIGDKISANLVISDQWMKNVDVVPKLSPVDINGNALPAGVFDWLTVFRSRIHERQVEGMIRFAELLEWPWIPETRAYMENVMNDLEMIRPIPFDVSDWIFGLLLPGKKYRHKIMSCLIASTASISGVRSPPFHDSGLALGNKSYWPSRSVLGRVLGGLPGVKSVCGWVGPCPKVEDASLLGWLRAKARTVTFPTPCSDPLDGMSPDGEGDGTGFSTGIGQTLNEAILMDICNINNWVEGKRIFEHTNHRVVLSKIKLQAVADTAGALHSLFPGSYSPTESRDYRPTLEFLVNGVTQSFTLYTNPCFVTAHPCVGIHVMMNTQASSYGANIVDATKLTHYSWDGRRLLVINALSYGAETVTRAWCAERGTHAVIRRGAGCCFACATSMTGKAGLGINVLIWT